MVKFIDNGSRAQPLKMQNPSTSLKTPPSTAIGNEELMPLAGEQQNYEERRAWALVTENKK